MDESERAKLKSKIDTLQAVYGVLFIGSLIALGARWLVPAMRTNFSFVVWAVLLAGAVGSRLYRNSLVNKYNAGSNVIR